MTPPHPVSTIVRWWPVVLWMAVIFAASSVPGSRLDDVDLSIPDKILHAVEYAVLGFLACRQGTGGIRRSFAVAMVIGVSVGILDENYQRLTPLRDPSVADWAADIVGTALGAGLAAGTRARARPGTRRNA